VVVCEHMEFRAKTIHYLNTKSNPDPNPNPTTDSLFLYHI